MAKRSDNTKPFAVVTDGGYLMSYSRSTTKIEHALCFSWPSQAKGPMARYKRLHPKAKLQLVDLRKIEAPTPDYQAKIDQMVGAGMVQITPASQAQQSAMVTLRVLVPADPKLIVELTAKLQQAAEAKGQLRDLQVDGFPSHVDFLQFLTPKE